MAAGAASKSLFGKLGSEKGRRADEPGAKVMGSRHAGKSARQEQGVIMARSSATHRRQQTLLAQQNIVGSNPQKRITEKVIAAQMSSLLDGMDPETVAKIAERNPETVRQWNKASRAPNSSSLLKLGADIPSIGDWIVSALGRDTGLTGVLENPQMLGVILSGLQQVAMQPGIEGTIARKLISQLTGGV